MVSDDKTIQNRITHTLVGVDVLIMLSLLCLCTWGVDRAIWDGFALLQPGSNLDSMHGTRLLVLLPRRSGDVSTNDSLNGKNLQLAHLHAPVLEHRPKRLWDLWREVEGEEMCAQRGDGLRQDLKPCLCAEGEKNALVRNTLLIYLVSYRPGMNWGVGGMNTFSMITS